jgi:hypothetical protein
MPAQPSWIACHQRAFWMTRLLTKGLAGPHLMERRLKRNGIMKKMRWRIKDLIDMEYFLGSVEK